MEGMGSMGVIVLGVLYFFAVKLQMKLFMHWAKKGKSTAITIYMIVTLFTFWLGFSTLFAMILTSARIDKQRNKVYDTLVQNPSDENVDLLIKDIEMFGCTNHPNAWNKLRAIWMTVNESSNITTDKKKQLKQFLMLKGLTMHYQDAKIIDNYRR